MKILIINGPNLNLLGTREPNIYGAQTLEQIENSVNDTLKSFRPDLSWKQSNSVHEIVNWVQTASENNFNAIVINPGALTHTSIALHDALLCFSGKKVEVHLSNTYKRDTFRNIKLTSKACDGVIEGFGSMGYELALKYVLANGE